ncbi:hypothetical protein ANN_03159 [Periplaneta americana]|uniref:Ig-like domain-containing protein n=1 Tax=Periplaneta americana TaxID=6978 RepID=A0ABQ8TY87_PERAM|nr:hypothetical protein ANN_03159 [Periplaneta americana]
MVSLYEGGNEPSCSLKAVSAQANIWGPEDVYVKKGSTISLTCSINVHSTPPGSVLWYHGASVVDFDSPRGGISLETEKTESGTTSKLLVTKAALTDSGNYTCVPSNANPASVWVHVLNVLGKSDISHFPRTSFDNLLTTYGTSARLEKNTRASGGNAARRTWGRVTHRGWAMVAPPAGRHGSYRLLQQMLHGQAARTQAGRVQMMSAWPAMNEQRIQRGTRLEKSLVLMDTLQVAK